MIPPQRPSRAGRTIDVAVQVLGQAEAAWVFLVSPGGRAVLAGTAGDQGLAHIPPAGLLDGRPAAWIGLWLVVAAVIGALWLRERAPRTAPLPAVAVGAALALTVVPLIGLVETAAARRKRVSVLIGALALAVLTLSRSVGVGVPLDPAAVLFDASAIVAALAFGMYVGTRQDLVAELTARAAAAESDQALREEQARQAERTRIAREMHDIVAHKISLVALHAGGLEMRPDLPPQEVEKAAALIRSTATSALAELREVLGVLRHEDQDKPLAPQPTWDDVRELARNSSRAGVQVNLFDFVEGTPPDAVARTAYRVVQEALTNIHKHAPSSDARIALLGSAGTELTIEVTNTVAPDDVTRLPGARMGLSGLETRVAHAGGTLEAGPTGDGHFDVKAVIPWPTP